jgi:LSD1 subclass zinc finger protein
MKPFIRVCKTCNEGIVVPTGSVSVKCTHCGEEYMVDWVPKLTKGRRWSKK